ncbi:hypothetical protein D915_009399 [Fasciola hepatica]|uniref:Uncharacterized protein n=1 Tax=Fasciola hepatica TaxID=6192 RepID=A0A4E0RSQ7_FASHE|nr:hypothetical protein D915_009399 [Fasciola hepatica]
MTMVLRCNNGCDSKELRHKFMQRLLDLGGSGRVGKVNTIYRGPNDEWKLFQVDFDVPSTRWKNIDTVSSPMIYSSYFSFT